MKGEVKISHVHLENALILSPEYVQLLIIENPSEFFSMVSSLVEQFDGVEGDFIFSRNNQIIDPEKSGAMIASPFHFDLNEKKIVTLLQKRLEGIALGEKITLFNELSAKTMQFLGELAFHVPFSLDYSEPQPSDYFKVAGLKLEKTYDSLEEKIICYINAWIELKKCDFFVFVNLKGVLSDEKLLQVYSHCESEQVGLLLIENTKSRPLLSKEKAVIITEDLCEILENYQD